MSVILTAGRKAVKPKSAKPKRKKPSKKSFDPTPPLSSAETTVWHWMLDRVPTTIMFSKIHQTVWCNGSILDTEVSFPEEEDDGAMFDFRLQVKEGHEHQATIKRLSAGGKKDVVVYQLFVDHCMILEHTSKQQVYPTPEAFGAVAEPPAYYEDPPCYDDVARSKKSN